MCFGAGGDGGRRGAHTGGLSDAQRLCILEIVDPIPANPDEIPFELRRQIGAECFQRPGQGSGGRLYSDDHNEITSGATSSQDEVATVGQLAGVSELEGLVTGEPDQQAESGATASAPALRELSQAELQIRDLIIEHNIEVPEMDATGVIGRLNNLRGSLTAGIQVLSIINDLVVKGRDVTDQEFAAVFDELEAQGIDLDIRN